MTNDNEKRKVHCDDCKSNVRKYCDGFIFKDFSGRYEGDAALLPKVPDRDKFWTYHECKKNTKGLKFINITGECGGFERAK